LELKQEITDKTGINSLVLPLDLAAEGSVESIVSFIRLHDVSVSILINNAGFGDHAPFEDADIKKLTSMINLNCTKLVELTHAMVPLMPKNSYIMNVASLAGFMPGPLMSVYYATKAFVLSFSQALHTELFPMNISSSALCPGPVHTEFGKVASTGGVAAFNSISAQNVEEVSALALKQMFKRKQIILTHPSHKLVVFLLRLVPRKIVGPIVNKAQSKRLIKKAND
jgi:short-subunit dehydrogenase